MPHKHYEDTSLKEKAIGKARQYEALLCARSLHQLPEGFKALSLCFDDFPQSAADCGAALLEDAGVRGTFYTCFGMLGTNGYAKPEDVIRLHKRGHEIACHTHSHINPSFNDMQAVQTSCKENIDAARLLNISLSQFCYPQGGITLEAKRMAAAFYSSSRSGFWGINGTTFDAHCLKSVPLYEGHMLRVNDFMKQLRKENGWLILYTHDVSDTPSEHGISTRSLKHIIETCQQHNIPVCTVRDVMKQATRKPA